MAHPSDSIIRGRLITVSHHNPGTFTPGGTTSIDSTGTIDLDNVPLNGGILLKILVFSLAPGLQVMMSPNSPVS